MKKQLVIALWMLGIVQFAFGENKTISYTVPQDFSTAKIVDSAYDGYKDIEYNGLDVILEPAGAPRLLTDVVSIDVPKKSKLVKATYEAEWVTLAENIKLTPVQPLIISEEAPKEIPFVEPDPALYAAYPASPISTFGVQRMAGKHFVPVRIIPFRYTNGKLEAAKKFVVTIEIETPPPLMQSMSSAAHEVAPGEDYVKNDPNQPDYILIAPKNYFNLWKWYVDERQKDHPEKKLLAKNFAEILADFPVNTDDPSKGYYARNDAERLHAYIRQEAHKGTHYFVLAGSWYDAHGCPADGYVTNTRKELQVTTPQAQYKTNADWGIPGIYTNPRNDPIPNEFIPGAKPCPSDLFYACCDLPEGAKYPWDYGSYEDDFNGEGDGWYANEPDDRIDLVADVVVTRIGFICGMTWRNDSYNLTMEDLVKGYLAKVRRAESPDFAGRNRFAGAGDTFSSEPGLAHGSTLREEMEFYTGSDNVFDKRHASYWMDAYYVVSLLQKDWFSRYLPAIHNEYISATTLPTGEPDWTTAVANLHKQDWEISTVFSHGSQGGSASQVYINEYAQKATGLSKIFFAPFPCLMSYPDWTPTGNRSGIHKITHNHSLIENPDGGATFAIGNTRSGWGGGIINRDCSVGDGLGVKMGGYFVKAYVRDRKTPGDAWLCMVQNYAQGGVGWSTGRWVLVIDQPLGDPLIETRFLEDYTWAGATTGEANWNLTDQLWTTNGVACVYDHAKTASITATDNLTMNVGANVVGALRLEVNQPTDATFKLTGGAVRVATNMVVSAGNVTFGVGGGVGHEGLEFLNGKGNIRFEGDKKFYLAKIKNGGTVTFAGSNGLIDFRNSYYSFDTDYSKRAIGDITTKKVNANTLDIEALAFEGEGTGNIIRSDYAGVLTQYLPAKIENQQFRLETYNGFDGALAEGKSFEIVNGKMTIANNPNYGLAENKCFEAIDIPLTLDNSTLEIERIKTFWFGRDEDSKQTITVRGNSAITASSNGRIGLYGTTTIALDNAEFTLSAPLDNRGNAKLIFTGSGTLTIENSTALAGDVEIGAGITVFLKSVPLPNVTTLKIGDNVKVVLPKNSSGTYQLTPLVGAQLIVGNGVTFYNGSLDNPMQGAIANTNGSVFDPSGVLTWVGQKNNLWSDDNWVQGTSTAKFTSNIGVLFADKAGEIPVQRTEVSVDGTYFGKFMQFANTKPYVFTGTTDNSTLAFGTLTVGGNTQFKDLDLVISGRTDLMSGKLDADRVNAEDISVYNGATLSAGKVGFGFDKIRHLRVYFLAFLKNDTTSSVEIKDSRVRMEELYLNYRDADGNLKTMRGGSKSLHGGSLAAGNLGMLFDGDAKHESAYRYGQNDSVEILAADGAMEAGNVYIQIDLTENMSMLDSFGVHSSKKPYSNGSSTHAYRPTKFRIEASYDGVTYYKIMPNNDNDSFGSNDIGGDSPAFKGGWVGGSETAFKCNYQGGVHPTSVDVQGGGALSAEGDYDANITLADGAIVKAVSGKQLTASETSTWAFPEGGKVTLDTSALTLSDEPQVVLEDALNFTFATLYQFEPSEGASLRYLNGGKIAAVEGDDMKGPYTRIFGGEENWNTNTAGGWHYYGEDAEGARLYLPFEKSWSEYKLDVATDVVIDLSADATITVDCNVEIDTIRACETNNLAGRSLTIVSDMVHTIKAQKLDFSGFDGDVVYGLDCGAAHVVAGQSLRLTGTGTGVLEVPSGATVTLTKPWQGTIIGNGTVILDPGEGNEWTDLSILKCNTTSTIALGSGSMNITEGTEITVACFSVYDGAKIVTVPTSNPWVLNDKNVDVLPGGELVLEIYNNDWIGHISFDGLVGNGAVVYDNKTGSTITNIGSAVPKSTLKTVLKGGEFAFNKSEDEGLAINASRIEIAEGTTFSANSIGDSNGYIKYIRLTFIKENGSQNYNIVEFTTKRNGSAQNLTGAKITCNGGSNLNLLVNEKGNVSLTDDMWVENFGTICHATIPANVPILFSFDNPIQMFSHYGIAVGNAPQPAGWDLEVSEDGVIWTMVSKYRGNTSTSGWVWIGWNGSALIASKPAYLTIDSGATFLAEGKIEAIVTLEAGAIIKPSAVAGKTMTLTNYADLMLPESGKVTVDLSGVEIERGTSIVLISGKIFTEADLKRFQLSNAPKGYHLELGANGTLNLRSAEHLAPRIIIK